MSNTPTDTEQPLRNSYNNQSLFSDHYLNHMLRGSDVWQHAFPQAQEFLAWLRELYAQEKAQLAEYNESQLEDKWFKPIFERLGHTWEGQPTIPAWKGNIKKPDFVFFPDEDARKTAVSLQNSTDYANAALAVGEVKQWGISLDKNRANAPIFDDKNPMYQIDSYLSLTRLDWGILSNGRLWRLIYRAESRSLDNYFEIDLQTMLDQSNRKQAAITATYFWLLFNQAAFQLNSDGYVLLHDVYTQSQRYKRELEENLRGNAYRALEQLILGFFNSNPTLSADNADHRDDVYRNSLYLLYRLLFLFYGESRSLLPIHNAAYQERYSLQKITERLNRNSRKYVPADSLPPTGRYYWLKLSETFRLISGDDEQLNRYLDVPRYNGGLFNSQQHPFLEQHIIGDRHLMKAIDYLANRRIIQQNGKPTYETVDYSTLDVRQLGSIYEGLLEYKVAVAVEEMVTVSKKGVETWLPLAQKGKSKAYDNRKQAGDLYLTTDKGERKATGSYYTPDYIVEYIVENTLSPLVAQVRERAGDGAFADGILRLNVLDPAMGSGHFLVEAMNYLAREIVADMPSTTELPGESDMLYWKRRVVEACIYGVDKNPMAVELAKLSLWLKTAAADKPLSFLDHHLQHGDSLIGASLDDLKSSPISAKSAAVPANQKSLFDDSAFTRDVGLAVGGVMAIERATSDTIADVHLKEQLWAELQQKHIGKWKQLADLWVSTFFGNTMSREEYRALADRLQGRDSLMSDAQAEKLLTHPAMTDNDYFHWNFIFPEVFFDEYGKPLKEVAGFDGVIGNPPYGDLLTENAKEFTAQSSNMRTGGRAEIYADFLANSLNTLKTNARLGFIIPNTMIDGSQFATLREYLVKKAKVYHIRDHRNRLVFAEANVLTMILFLDKQKVETVYSAPYEFLDNDKDIFVQSKLEIMPNSTKPWQITNMVMKKLKSVDQYALLHPDIAQCRDAGVDYKWKNVGWLNRGKQEPLSKILFYSGKKRKVNDYPLIKGENINRYFVQHTDNYLIHDFSKYKNDKNAILVYLDLALVPIKILTRQTASQIQAAIDTNQYVTAKSVHTTIVTADSYSVYFVQCVLNSNLINYVYNMRTGEAGRTFAQIKLYDLRDLPIPRITFDTLEYQKTAVSQQSQTLYHAGDHTALLALVATELGAGRNDTIHDLLAFLAEQMIVMNKQKQTALEAFWLDLEGVAEPAAFAILRNKGKWEKSLHKAVPAARPFVDESSRSSVPLSASLSWNEDAFKGFVKLLLKKVRYFSAIVGVYGDHKTAVATLNQQLTATDRLIDQIVYQLYGLTDEEIAIVEGQ